MTSDLGIARISPIHSITSFHNQRKESYFYNFIETSLEQNRHKGWCGRGTSLSSFVMLVGGALHSSILYQFKAVV